MVNLKSNYFFCIGIVTCNRNIAIKAIYNDQYNCNEERICRSFDKSIIDLRIAVKKIGSIVETIEDDWIFYDILLHHKNMLNSQIDLLVKEKRKYKNKKCLHKLRKVNVYHC